MQTVSNRFLALDYGERRVGVAVASSVAKLPRPLNALEQSARFMDDLRSLIEHEEVSALVVGLPRGMQGQDTAQTVTTKAFANSLHEQLDLPVYLQDETLTSVQAEAELRARGQQYEKGMIDSMAAVYILEDYLQSLEQR